MRARLLDEALTLAPRLGWTRACLEQAAANVGLPSIAHGLASEGEVSLVAHFVQRANSSLQSAVTQRFGDKEICSLPLRQRLKACARTRLELVLPVAHNWHQALGVLAVPYNLHIASSLLAQTADEIVHCARDQSTDFAWYVKRGLVGTAYASSELFMLSDASEGKRETWKFLDSQLDRVVWVMQQSSTVSKLM